MTARWDRAHPKQPSRSSEEWDELGATVILDLIDTETAVTVREIEARAADRVWDASLCPTPIAPHHLTNARNHLHAEGAIEPLTERTRRNNPDPITTWSRPPARGTATRIRDTSARKRILTARHQGWSTRGGAGKGLIGAAGEQALQHALNTSSAHAAVTGPLRELDGIPLLGELDNSSAVVVRTDSGGLDVVRCLYEVKNTREHYYPDHDELDRFLTKCAAYQHHRPDELVLPVWVSRQRTFALWDDSEQTGYLPAKVVNQLIVFDSELSEEHFNQVRNELGYRDLRPYNGTTTNRHAGLVNKSIPDNALAYAQRWKTAYTTYLPTD